MSVVSVPGFETFMVSLLYSERSRSDIKKCQSVSFTITTAFKNWTTVISGAKQFGKIYPNPCVPCSMLHFFLFVCVFTHKPWVWPSVQNHRQLLQNILGLGIFFSTWRASIYECPSLLSLVNEIINRQKVITTYPLDTCTFIFWFTLFGLGTTFNSILLCPRFITVTVI